MVISTQGRPDVRKQPHRGLRLPPRRHRRKRYAAGHRKLKTLFGYQLTSGPFDDPIQDVSVCFLSRGGTDPALELVAALGPNSPVHRLVKKGGGTYHLCYTVPDIDAAIAHLTAHYCLLLTQPVPAVAFEGRKIAWLISDTGLFELIQA